ncbi:MAG: sulfatase-like hydrolase/transferase [Bacteroidales bacterium]|jgi:phosphoglycerol transferase MdoB-like AlkP superfamily enzyme
MKRKITIFLLYSLFWLFFFIFARALFLLAQFRELITYSPAIILGTFIHGFCLDLATTGYILLIPLIFSVPAVFLPGKWFRIFIKVYSSVLIIFFSGIILGDAAIYSYWGFRLEFSVLWYLKNPIDAMASASTLQMILYILAIIVMSFIFIAIHNRLIDRFLKDDIKTKKPVVTAVLFLIIAGAMIIPIRGGLGVAPLNAGSVYFSSSLFPNHAAINIIWNFGHSAIYSKPTHSPYKFFRPENALEDFRDLLKDNGTATKVLRNQRPNILIIIIESFGSYLTDQSAPDSVVTPRFREYIPQGLYFSNIYAAGSRTDKAVPAIMSGYPNLPLIQVIREPKKTQSMPGIIKLLDSSGYNTSFWYGGDIDFANMNSYITTTGFRKKITKNNFRPQDCNSKWGAHDEILLNLLQDSLPKLRQPFACAVLTLSSHEPFEVPMKPVIKGDDVLSKFRNSIYYTDRSLGNFLDKASNTEWWKNTLVILLADHCRRNTQNVPVYSEQIFKIPMLWLGGALAVKNVRISKLGNQFDLPLTLADQLDLKSNFIFSKDLLSPVSSSFAFYTFNEGFAFITDSSTAVYDVKMKKDVMETGKDPAWASRMGKSFLQVLYDDYLSR